MNNTAPQNSASLTVFFDGSCPLCIQEIGFYRRRRGADDIDWVDVSAEDAATPAGVLRAVPSLSRCDAMARFHVMDADGTLHSGGDAFARLWSALPAFRIVGAVARVQPIRWLLNKAYDGFLRFRPGLQRLAAEKS